ncbi:MFS transporter [Paeniglutamicibacter sp. Y32M11]|uniref:MFS transporter n=1 Tax=Paeniglutamicibacter sp. Y32M11 TaxID=2853258 RepID=UPI001C528DE7|nr:MFS transporter [Paeniglutamicibacter sp. Y32M11]QXQ11296.1 MFS transporter [Paeniglutamicibacter sp. Y32M11]
MKQRPRVRNGVPVLLGTQTLFNIGFYTVVPFLALVLTEDFGLAGTAVGLILGVRTFAQQGLFIVGGTLADRFGARSVILVGCAVRALGFFTLAASLFTGSPILWLFISGTLLTGFGGALFSPGLNVLVAAVETTRRDGSQSAAQRVTLFAWLSITGEIGAVVGPLVGAALWGWGFATVAGLGAAFFLGIGVLLWRTLGNTPRPETSNARSTETSGRSWGSLRDRRFIAFAGLHAVDLLAYNQLYLAIPLELGRAEVATQFLGLVFAWVSVLTLALQLPISWLAARVGAPRALRMGYILGALGFCTLGITGIFSMEQGTAPITILAAVTLLALGHMTAHSTALGLIPRIAGARPVGSYYGLLATCGGIAVLLGNLLIGGLLNEPASPGPASILPWLVLIVPLLLAAFFAPGIVRGLLTRSEKSTVPTEIQSR